MLWKQLFEIQIDNVIVHKLQNHLSKKFNFDKIMSWRVSNRKFK